MPFSTTNATDLGCQTDENEGGTTTMSSAAPASASFGGIGEAVRSVQPTPPEQRLVGLAYSVAFPPVSWDKIWGTPQLQPYHSDDPVVIRQHAAWIVDAGVDFVWIDWSNNINHHPTINHHPNGGGSYRDDIALLENNTDVLFRTYAELDRHPKISIFLGFQNNFDAVFDGRLQRKADQLYEQYVKPYGNLLQQYEGKPLLAIYIGTPSPAPFRDGPVDWTDPRFTVRWFTGFLTQQPYLLQEGTLLSKYAYWSWEDRGPATYSVHNGMTEAMVVTAAWRQQAEPGATDFIPAGGRRNGTTFREAWARARALGPKFALVVAFNEWVLWEGPSAEVSKDIEPSVMFGDQYMRILKEEIARFKCPDGFRLLSAAPSLEPSVNPMKSLSDEPSKHPIKSPSVPPSEPWTRTPSSAKPSKTLVDTKLDNPTVEGSTLPSSTNAFVDTKHSGSQARSRGKKVSAPPSVSFDAIYPENVNGSISSKVTVSLPSPQQTWSHSTNSTEALTEAWHNADISAIEADILIGLDGSAIMAHPPNRTSDLSLQAFLDQSFGPAGLLKHIKLDFKEIKALSIALEILGQKTGLCTNDEESSSEVKTVFLNADILPGPGCQTGHLDSDMFLQSSLDFIESKLRPANIAFSLGFKVDYRVEDENYGSTFASQSMAQVVRRYELHRKAGTYESGTISLWSQCFFFFFMSHLSFATTF